VIQHPTITVLGSYSGRNAGDAAILFQIADDFAREVPESLLLVPTTHPGFIQSHFDPNRVKAVRVLPWDLSVRVLGWPLVRCIRRSQLVLITDGILFDIRLYDPLFSFMPAMGLAAFLCGRWKIPLVGYNVGAGPFTTGAGRSLGRYICRSCDHIYAREEDTRNLLEEIGTPREKISVAADCVFALEGLGRETGRRVLSSLDPSWNGPWIGFNVTSYLGTWLRVGLDRSAVLRKLAAAADRLLERLPVRLAVVTTQIMDISFARQMMDAMTNKDKAFLVTNERLNPRELVSVFSQFELFLGMRLHSLILATAAETTAIGIVYAPKVRSFMDLMGLGEYCVELVDFEPERFSQLSMRAWQERKALRERVRQRRSELAEKALETPLKVAEAYFKNAP